MSKIEIKQGIMPEQTWKVGDLMYTLKYPDSIYLIVSIKDVVYYNGSKSKKYIVTEFIQDHTDTGKILVKYNEIDQFDEIAKTWSLTAQKIIISNY